MVCSISQTIKGLDNPGVFVARVVSRTELARALAFVYTGPGTALKIGLFSQKPPTSKDSKVLAVSTVGGTQFVAAGRLNLQLMSDNNKQIEPGNAYTLANLPM